ncbi:MAG TPA: hemerythrin domain-containing protein [Aeromicrobium sp.]|nr:hemerythrin domain-containing protein [Aeromicrobium sp.]
MTSVLESTLESEHQRIREFADAAAAAEFSADEPRIRHRLSDTFSAVLSRHLAAVDDVLLPAAKSSTVYKRAAVRDHVRQVRVLEKVLHELKARVYGAATAGRVWEGLWGEIDRHLADLAERETALAQQLAARLSDTETCELADRFAAAAERAPTRPHAYTPHTGRLGRLSRRIWRIADGFWDEAEGRVIPHRPAKPPARPDSLMHRYMTGAPPQQSEES